MSRRSRPTKRSRFCGCQARNDNGDPCLCDNRDFVPAERENETYVCPACSEKDSHRF